MLAESRKLISYLLRASLGIMLHSAGTLLYRTQENQLQVLIVHPSGAYNRKKKWSIPKGLPDPGESLEAAARRETQEETGVVAQILVELSSIKYSSGKKTVYCFAGPAPDDAQPHCASWEVDRAEFVPLDQARELLHKDQRIFLDQLQQHLAGSD